jgi:hypothetical protein
MHKPPPPIRPRRRITCHRWLPSHTQMEPNRSAARPPSLSRTSSVPVDSPPPFTPRNSWELNPHHCWPPTLPGAASPRPTRPYKRKPNLGLQVPPHRALRATVIHHRHQPSSVTPPPNAARGEDPFVRLSLPSSCGKDPILCPWSMVDRECRRSTSPWTWSTAFSF